jgi:hypothetical protein
MTKGQHVLASLRQSALISRHAKFAAPVRQEARDFVQVTKPTSKRSAKGASSKTRTLKVRNWQIKDAHFN